MAQMDPWEKVAECEEALKQATDPRSRTVLTELRDLWITLANESQLLGSAQFQAEVEALGRMYSEWASSTDKAVFH
jgi:hypothetical protein